jgi:uncharacterized membrane protein YphA (DoxX/SURF4 family)
MEIDNKSLRSIWSLLRLVFGLVPIVAGLDKFTDLLVNWDMYVHPAIAGMINAHTFMMIVGVIEIITGIIVLINSSVGAFILMAWLIAIALQLIASGRYLDIAVRDLVMSCGAYTLGRISQMIR